MDILVVGGGGYIGSHMVKMLHSQGYRITVFDSFVKGYRDAIVAGDIVEGDLADAKAIDHLFETNSFESVMHFASFIEVGESIRLPEKYYQNNFCNTKNLLDVMVRHQVSQFIFSSTAAVFGEPEYVPIDELHPRKPINPYGKSKLMVEELLQDYDYAYGVKSVSLRYFNAAGADPEGKIGERHDPETHLIPLVLQAASGRREVISIFGEDYDTADGSCIRDFIHVNDLCDAHLLALQFLLESRKSDQFNLGNGQGFSVKQVIDCACDVTGRDIPVSLEARRKGDPAVLVADASKAKSVLGWKPGFSELEKIIETAWQWEQSYFLR